jgi:cytochrome c biogenesis protein CcdA
MIIWILAFLGGALTILSPCILPVLPFVFARADRSFWRSTVPMLGGMAVTFAAIATLAAVGGSWAVRFNDYGRILALVLLAVSGLALIFDQLASQITRPLVGLGNRLMSSGPAESKGSIVEAAVLGIATGFVWAPCAGPILGLILTGAALRGPSTQTTALLFAYAAGAMVSLAIAALAGNRIFTAMKRSLGFGEWVRRGLGIAVIAAVVVIALGWDTSVLTNLSLASTNHIEQSLIEKIHPQSVAAVHDSFAMPIEGDMPPLDGAVMWFNSPPLTRESLRGKVVLVDFWTYSCINCLRTLPYIKEWYRRYQDDGLVVIGVHSPEFAFEKNPDNVKRAIQELQIPYPVALDSNLAIWSAFNNQYWPAHYFVDADGHIRSHHFGEGDYEESEQILRRLLAERGARELPAMATSVQSQGIQAAADENDIQSPETYIGYERGEHFASQGGVKPDHPAVYTSPSMPTLNQWGLAGNWQVNDENAISIAPGARIVFRFHARDLHLVLGPGPGGKPVRFRVTIDGAAPGADHGVDTDESGAGRVTEQRLYQLVRQSGTIHDRTFTIEFLNPGVVAYSFTFG